MVPNPNHHEAIHRWHRWPAEVEDLRQRLFTDSIQVTLTESEEDGENENFCRRDVLKSGEIPWEFGHFHGFKMELSKIFLVKFNGISAAKMWIRLIKAAKFDWILTD